MPRVLKIDSITHRPICKTAGAGGFSGHNYLCHSKARIGVTGQCKRCTIPFFESGVSIDKMVGCGNAVPCGAGGNSGTGWDFDLAFGTGSSYAATQTNTGDGSAADEWASVVFSTGASIQEHQPFTYKWTGAPVQGKTTAGVGGLAPNAAGFYSVTVTDKNGKTITKEMPAIYTRMITKTALEAFTTGNVALTEDNHNAASGVKFKLNTTGAVGQANFAAVIGGKPPLEIRMHAYDLNANGYTGTPAQHAAADAKTIRLDRMMNGNGQATHDHSPNPGGAINQPGTPQISLVHNPSDHAYSTIYLPRLHTTSGPTPHFEMASDSSDLHLWETLDGTMMQPGGIQNPEGAGLTWPEPGSRLLGANQNSAIKWHMSIRDADGKVIRIPTQNKISVA